MSLPLIIVTGVMTMAEYGYLTTTDAAAILQVSRRRVHELIKLGTLKAERFGNAWQVDSESVEAYKNSPRKAGARRKECRLKKS